VEELARSRGKKHGGINIKIKIFALIFTWKSVKVSVLLSVDLFEKTVLILQWYENLYGA
jgi:hypothetical protein